MPAKTVTKSYRPSLDADTIKYLSQLATREFATNNHPLALRAIGKLAPFVAKIEAGAVKPSHTYTPKVSVLEQLGVDTEDSNTLATSNDSCSQTAYTPEEAYKLWREAITNNDFSLLNIDLIAQAKDYAYLNDLLTTEEEEEYERSLNITNK